MEIKVFNDEDRSLYNNFLLQSEYKDILQSWQWGEIKSKFNFNWKAIRIGFLENKELKGIAQILERKLPFGFSLLYIPRGPVTDWDNLNLVQDLTSSLKDFIDKFNKKTIFLRLEPPVNTTKKEVKEILKNNGFKKYFKIVQPPSTLLIDLTPSEENLFKTFRRTARNLIYRSEREGITVGVFNNSEITIDELKGFYNLYRETGKRFSFSLRPFKQFEYLLKEAGELVTLKLYKARIKGLILAYGLVLILGDKAFYIWGGTSRHKSYSKFFNYGYVWAMLKDLKNSGVKTFDFWGLGPLDNKKHPWYGFSLFKTAFGGERSDYIGAFELSKSKLNPLFKVIDRVITPKYRATSS
ncbi:MAG: methicillin resistance protein [Parcubacteria group bacterium Gr01-1014_2]|nr:MAG: methicillin resistance protein [Parcubacteria group bacterium Gr01-1014_2]